MVRPIPTTSRAPAGSFSTGVIENYPTGYRGGDIYRPRPQPRQTIKEDLLTEERGMSEEEYLVSIMSDRERKKYYASNKYGKSKLLKQFSTQGYLSYTSGSGRRRTQEANLSRLQSLGVVSAYDVGGQTKYLTSQGLEREKARIEREYSESKAASEKKFLEETKGMTAGELFAAGYNIYPEDKGGVSFRRITPQLVASTRRKFPEDIMTGQSIIPEKESKRLTNFRAEIEAQEQRQEKFYLSLENIRPTARYLTLGGSSPYSDRSWVGKFAENVAFNFMAAPLSLGGGLSIVGEKLYLTGKAITFKETRENILPTYGAAFKPTLSQMFPSALTPEGAAYYGTIAVGASLHVGTIKYVQKQSLLKSPESMRQISKPETLFTLEKTRATEARYTKTNLPKSEFIVSEIIKSKRVSVAEEPKILTLKFETASKGRTGTMQVIKDISTGKTSTIERIQQQGLFFKNQKDFIKVTEQLSPKQFNIKVFKTSDFMTKNQPKAYVEKIITYKEPALSLGTQKTTINAASEPLGYDPFTDIKISKIRTAKQSNQILITKQTISGDILQTTKFKVTTAQEAALEKPYFVSVTKQPKLIIGSKETYIGYGESVKSIKSVIQFGKESLEPNVIEINKIGVTTLNKYPQKSTQVFTIKDIDVQINKLSPQELKTYTSQQKGTLTSGKLSDLNLQQIKLISRQKPMTFQEKVFDYAGGLKTELIRAPKSTKVSTISSELPKTSFENLGKYQFNIPKTEVSTSRGFLFIPSLKPATYTQPLNKNKLIPFQEPTKDIIYTPIMKQKQPYMQIPEKMQQPIQQQRQRKIQQPIQIMKQKQPYMQIPEKMQQPIQQQRQRKIQQPIQIMKQKQNIAAQNRTITPIRVQMPNIKMRTPIIPVLFKFDRKKKSSKKTQRKQKDIFKYKYTPTLEAALFDVKAFKTNITRAKTGLVLRPILIKKM